MVFSTNCKKFEKDAGSFQNGFEMVEFKFYSTIKAENEVTCDYKIVIIWQQWWNKVNFRIKRGGKKIHTTPSNFSGRIFDRLKHTVDSWWMVCICKSILQKNFLNFKTLHIRKQYFASHKRLKNTNDSSTVRVKLQVSILRT